MCSCFDVIETDDGLWLSCDTCSEDELAQTVAALEEALKDRL